MAIARAQSSVHVRQTGTSISASYGSTPTQGNLLTCCLMGVNQQWTGPSGWASAFNSNGTSTNVAIFYKQAGASESTSVSATEGGTTDDMAILLDEWGGFPGGSIVLDLAAWADNAVGLTASVNPGSIATGTELVMTICGIASSGSASPSWNQAITLDQNDTNLSPQFITGSKITSVTQSFSPTTCTWTTSQHSSTVGLASFKAVSLPNLPVERWNQAVKRSSFY